MVYGDGLAWRANAYCRDLELVLGRQDRVFGSKVCRNLKELILPTLPIPLFSSLVLGFLLIRMVIFDRRHGPLAVLLAICAAQGVDLSRFRAAPGARLSHLSFEGDRAFPAQC